MNTRRLFVAGANGATGRVVCRFASERDIDCHPHLRPKTAERLGELPPNAAVCDLYDADALSQRLASVTTVVQLIGTMRKRFKRGDTYQTSDIGTTAQLVAAAAKNKVDHIVLLSSVGAGSPLGPYLKAKAKAERIVMECGIAFTIFRPSSFDGEGHTPPFGFRAITNALRLHKYKPIPVATLAGAILHSAATRAPLNTVLEGKDLWDFIDSY